MAPYRDGSIKILQPNTGLKVICTQQTSGLDGTAEDLTLVMIRSRTRGVAKVDGAVVVDGYIQPYTTGFFAPFTPVFSYSEPHDTSLIQIGQDVFDEVAGRRVQLIPWRKGLSGTTNDIFNAILSASREERDPILIEHLKFALAASLLKDMNGDVQINTEQLSAQRNRRVVEYVEANLDRQVSLEDLANVAAMSAHHFARSFKATMGVTPVRYLWEKRLERAKALLRDNDHNLASIAFECGFRSQSHFATLFKRATGMTPSAWRVKTDP